MHSKLPFGKLNVFDKCRDPPLNILTSVVLHFRTLYSIKRENIASRELGFLNRPSVKGLQSRAQNNIEHQIEKNYILNSRLANATPEIFPRVIMKHFFRISAPRKTLGYGMPRPGTRENNQFKRIMEGLHREPSLVRLDNYPDLQMPIGCDRTSEFCEILGPSSCSTCIENTNRHIGNELQDMLFPTIDMSVNKLIVPKLGKVLREGHRHQVRLRRMHELGLDIPNDMLLMKREESPLSSKTCLNCKKKINTKPTNITIKLPSGKSSMPSIYTPDKSATLKVKNKRSGLQL